LAADAGSDVVDVSPVGFVRPFFVGQQRAAEHHHVGGAVPQHLFGGVGVVQFSDFHNGDGHPRVGEYAVAGEGLFNVAGDGGEAGGWHGVRHVGEPPVVVAAQVHVEHVDAGFHHRDIKISKLSRERLRIREICFSQAQDRVDIAHEGGDEGPLDKPGTRWWIGHGGDDEHLVRIRHHDALVGVGVIGGAPKNGGALFQLHYAR